MNRRAFLGTAAGALAYARPAWADRLGIMCQLGAAEDAAKKTLAAARSAGFEIVQVNFAWDRVEAAFLRGLPRWLRDEGLRCDVLSAYVNCLDPGVILMGTRREDFERAIDYAGEVGASRLVAWTGSHSPDLMKPDERNFAPRAQDRIVRFLEPFAGKLEQSRRKLALETYITLACPDAPSLRKLLDRLPPCIGAVLDPPNLTPLARFADRDAVMEEMFAALRERIVVVHMKDFRMAKGGGGYELPGPLNGEMNYRLFASHVSRLAADVPVIAEHLEPAQFADARRRLLAL